MILRRSDRGRSGFTLMELMVALAVAGLVLLSARGTLAALADLGERISTAGTMTDRDSNAERLLRVLVWQVEVGHDSTRLFTGDERAARFWTWCAAPGGWSEPCAVELVIAIADSMQYLSVKLPDGFTFAPFPPFREGRLRYLNSATQGGEWFREWGPSMTAPLAIGLTTDTETVLLRIGARS